MISKHFLVSATYAPRLDALEQQTTETAPGGIYRFSCTSQFHCAQAHATDLSQDQVHPSLEGATLSLLRYDSKFTTKSVKSVITRSRYPGFVRLQAGTLTR